MCDIRVRAAKVSAFPGFRGVNRVFLRELLLFQTFGMTIAFLFFSKGSQSVTN